MLELVKWVGRRNWALVVLDIGRVSCKLGNLKNKLAVNY